MIPTIEKLLGCCASIKPIEEPIGKDPSQQLLILSIAQPFYQGLAIQRELDVWIITEMIKMLYVLIPK
jgi:hypothetical protein